MQQQGLGILQNFPCITLLITLMKLQETLCAVYKDKYLKKN